MFDVMEVFWVLFLILCLIVEAATVQLVSIWFAIGSVGAIIAARLGANSSIQIIICLIISFVLLFATKPIAKRLAQGKATKTNTDRIIGEKAVVIEEINNDKGTGQIRVMNQIWTARAIIPEMFFPADSEVIVHEISGVKAMVRPVQTKRQEQNTAKEE